jgi:predicted nuclease with RNAse H fold
MHFCDEDSLSDTFTIPFWAARLSKKNLQTLQLSIRGGEISCRHNSDRVIAGGKAVIYSSGEVYI